MSDTTGFKTGAPVFSPEFSDMIDRCVELFKLDIVQGLAFAQEPALLAARGVQSNPSRLGPVVARRLQQIKTGGKRGRTAAQTGLANALTALYSADIRSLARRQNIDLSAATPVMRQVNVAQDFLFLGKELGNSQRLDSLQDNLFDMKVDATGADENDSEGTLRRLAPNLTLDPAVMRMLAEHVRPLKGIGMGGTIGGTTQIVINKGLEFRINKVKCIDETNPEWPGDDEIAMGGTAVAPSGAATKVAEFMVAESFDDGETKTYTPPRLLKTFSLSGVSYPADFLMVLGMAEKDNGGLSDFLNDLWEAIKDEVQVIVAAVSAAAGAAIGAGIGGTIGTAIGGPLGSIIGLAAGAILGALVGWLISAIKDDIFTPQTAAVHLPKSNATFTNGALTSPQFSLNFRDHGGHYRVYYSWKINR